MKLRCLVLGGVLAAALLSGCSDDGPEPTPGPGDAATSPEHFAVGLVEQTYVDDSRPTPANGDIAERPERTLVTKILYPAEGDAGSRSPVEGAVPDAAGGPYPLVVFSHGLGGSYEYYQALIQQWAAAGYVVAAPHFPLTYAGTPGGPNAADVQRQPGDVSFVIDQILDPSPGDSLLYGLVDPDAIAIAGHSNGAITTLGAAANSCCREPRARAAIVLAGTDAPYSGGDYDLSDTPPILWVHGTEDDQLAYDAAVAMFNQAEGPKGLLTLEGQDHGSWLSPSDELEGVGEATTDFLDAYLRDEGDAQARLAEFEAPGMTMNWVGEEGSTVTIPTLPPPETDRMATATPTTGLTQGQLVTVTWEGFIPGGTINIVQCSGDGSGGSAACDLNDAFILQPNPTGEGSTTIDMVVGPVGDGVCDAANPCNIVVNDSALQDEDALIYLPVTFAN